MYSQSATISESTLSETGDLLDGIRVTVEVSGTKFYRLGVLPIDSMTVENGPSVLSITRINVIGDSSVAEVDLQSLDFDSNYPDFYISIDSSVLLSGSNLSTATCSITANIEIATLSSDPAPLSERNIGNGTTAYLDIHLNDTEYFLNNGNDLEISDITLINFPDGIEKDHFDYGGPTNNDKARLYISFDPAKGDIDSPISNAAVTINPADLDYSTDTLGSTSITITGLDESVYSDMADNLNLREDTLNGGLVVLTLVNDEVPTGSISVDSIILDKFPSGTTIQYVEGISGGDQINVFLNFTGEDFDSHVTDAQVRVRPGILKWNKMDELVTDIGDLTITAIVEVPGATISPDIDLEEYNLNNRTITVSLTHDSLTTPFSLVTDDITLVDAPAGLSVASVSVNNAMEFEVTLAYTHNDFDADIELGLSINHLKLNVATSDLVSSNTATITYYPETPVAMVTPSSTLREAYLDTISLHLEFSEEKFSSPPGVSDFAIVSGPGGLDINGISNQADSSITLHLRFDGTDFDADFNSVEVSIKSGVLDQTKSDLLLSEEFLVASTYEPVVGSVSIGNNSMKIGDDVEVTINLTEYESGSLYTLAPILPKANIGGYEIVSLQRDGVDNRYKARITITEFGNDYPDSVDIPVNNLQFVQFPDTGEIYNGFISQDKDMLDAHRPVISTLYVIGQEDKKIGDNVVLLISAFEEGLVPEDSSEINNIVMTPDKVVFEEIGGGTYSLIYTIGPNDQNVAKGDLEAKIYLRDPAGNINLTYPAIQPNDLSIDASVPVIFSTTNTTPTDTVIIGGEVILTVKADGMGYKLSNTSEVNGVRKNEGLIFSSDDSTYTIRYPVNEFDPTVQVGELEALIILEDAVGNGSLPDTVIDDNTVAVLTKKPTARLTLGDEICIYDTATIYMTLSGSPPWRLKYHNAVDSFYVDNIQTTNFSVKVTPEQTMNYIIDSVWDGTGNTNIGFDNAIVIVNPLPVVNIIDLDTIYAVTDSIVELNGDPSEGEFSGEGVSSIHGTFSPSIAGLTDSIPHWIYYEYIDTKSCFNVDSQAVEIVDADVTFIWPERKVACYLDQEYILEAFNTASSLGSFISTDSIIYPVGFMVDNKNNTVTFNPSILDWVEGEDYKIDVGIRYDYLDGKTHLYKKVDLKIEYFDTAYIVTDLTTKEPCSYDEIFSLVGSRIERGVFTSEGHGVDSLGNDVYEFDRSKADTGLNKILYTYTSTNGCKQYDSATIMVNEVPNPEFEFVELCVPSPDGGVINFNNTSDITGLPDSIKWEWNFGDIQSGADNVEVLWSLEGVSHNYSRPGERNVTLAAKVIETGCENSKIIRNKYIGNTPNVSIDWNTECFTSEPIELTGSSETEDGNSKFNWLITDLAGNEFRSEIEEGVKISVLAHKFDVLDNYKVELTATSDSGCVNSVSETIYLRPYISGLTESTPYYEDFEADSNGWFAFNMENSTQSWVVEAVDPGKFPYDVASDGNKAWYTDSVDKNTVEQSWVTSPCFDFRGMRRPMISLDRKISSDRDRDGAVLQYSYDDGSNWKNVGAVDDGSINWYNTFRIADGPGGQGEGWTGGFLFDRSEPWKNSRHDLDVLINRDRVQFRIAYSSADTSAVPKEGFAFDNVWIGERSRVVLLEHFTNASIDGIEEKNQRINKLVQHNLLDVIDVQYHAEVEGNPDKMNEDNPSPASARSLFYGTRKVPYTLIDGGLGGEMAYDFTENNDLDTLDLVARILDDPSFSIEQGVVEQGNSLDISIDIEALESLPQGEYIVYTAIIEKHINESSYLVSGADTAFQNVVRDMVPNAAGVSLIRQWEPGDKESISLSWDISDIILNRELVNVVVFIQGAENRMIYQASSNDPELNGDPVAPVSVHDLLKARNIEMLVYPNPASSRVYLAFAEPLSEKVQIQLFTHTGSLVLNDLLSPGTELYEVSLKGLSKGVYFIRAIQDGQIIGTRKLLKME